VPRWAPASAPWATMASTPAASRARASATVVAVPTSFTPLAPQPGERLGRRDAEGEAEGGRPRLEHRPELRLEGLGHPGGEGRRREAELLVVGGRGPRASRRARRVGRRRLEREQVHGEGAVGEGPDGGHLPRDGLGAEVAAGDRAEAARVADGRGQRRGGAPAPHRSLDDRVLEAEEPGQRRREGHGFLLRSGRPSPYAPSGSAPPPIAAFMVTAPAEAAGCPFQRGGALLAGLRIAGWTTTSATRPRGRGVSRWAGW
jgi:hypothetical protein